MHFRIEFETCINKFPQEKPINDEDALDIFLEGISPTYRQLLTPSLYELGTWTAACSRAIYFENRMEYNSGTQVSHTSQDILPLGNHQDDMEIDFIRTHGRQNSSYRGNHQTKSYQNKQQTKYGQQQPRGNSQFRNSQFSTSQRTNTKRRWTRMEANL